MAKTLEGYVGDAEGRPFVGVEAVVTRVSDGGLIDSGASGPDGRWAFTGLSEGDEHFVTLFDGAGRAAVRGPWSGELREAWVRDRLACPLDTTVAGLPLKLDPSTANGLTWTAAGLFAADGYSKIVSDSRFVNATGDTMTGRLNINVEGSSHVLRITNAPFDQSNNTIRITSKGYVGSIANPSQNYDLDNIFSVEAYGQTATVVEKMNFLMRLTVWGTVTAAATPTKLSFWLMDSAGVLNQRFTIGPDGATAIFGSTLIQTTGSPPLTLEASGLATDVGTLTIRRTGTSSLRTINLYAFIPDAGEQAIAFYRARGTLAAPTNIAAGDYMSAIDTWGYFNGNYRIATRIISQAGAVTGSVVPGTMTFQVADEAGALQSRLFFGGAGSQIFGVYGRIDLNINPEVPLAIGYPQAGTNNGFGMRLYGADKGGHQWLIYAQGGTSHLAPAGSIIFRNESTGAQAYIFHTGRYYGPGASFSADTYFGAAARLIFQDEVRDDKIILYNTYTIGIRGGTIGYFAPTSAVHNFYIANTLIQNIAYALSYLYSTSGLKLYFNNSSIDGLQFQNANNGSHNWIMGVQGTAVNVWGQYDFGLYNTAVGAVLRIDYLGRIGVGGWAPTASGIPGGLAVQTRHTNEYGLRVSYGASSAWNVCTIACTNSVGTVVFGVNNNGWVCDGTSAGATAGLTGGRIPVYQTNGNFLGWINLYN